jgi:hypothetical protein
MAYPRFRKSRAHKKDVRTAGNLTLNSASWADVPTISDFVIEAQVGDDIEYGMNAYVDATGAADVYFDVATIVSGAPVNYFNNGTATPAVGGVSSWMCEPSIIKSMAGCVIYTVQAGDIVDGKVTLRLRYDESAAVARTLRADTTRPLHRYVKNLGPAAT